MWQVVVRTPVVEEVTAPMAVVERELASRNASAVGSAYVYWADRKVIEAVLAHIVHDETEALRSDQLAAFGILQLCQAEEEADELSTAVGGQVADRQHPERGPRAQATTCST